jgi:hypothetical protein
MSIEQAKLELANLQLAKSQNEKRLLELGFEVKILKQKLHLEKQ